MEHFKRLGFNEKQVTGKMDAMLDFAEQHRVINSEERGKWSNPETLIGSLDFNNDQAYQLQVQFRMKMLTDSLPYMKSQWQIRSDLIRRLPFTHSRLLMPGGQPIASLSPEALIEVDSFFDIRISYLTVGTHETGTDLKPGHLVEASLVWKACLRAEGIENPKEIAEYQWEEIKANRKLSNAARKYFDWFEDGEVVPFREYRAYISQIALLAAMREQEKDPDFAFYLDDAMKRAFVNLEGYLNLLSEATPKMQILAQTTHKELVEEARDLLSEENKYVR